MIFSEKPIGALCTQKDIDSSNYSRISRNLLRHKPRYHRKQWEFVYILRVLEFFKKLNHNCRGIGFGCGKERIVPVMANFGSKILATDFSDSGWAKSNHHSTSVKDFERMVKKDPSLCDLDKFYSNVSHMSVDMNNINPELLKEEYDFTWSACSLEHLGSLNHGIDFIINSLDCLRTGGVAVHTTEYNLSSNEKTVNEKSVCYYRRRDIEELLSKCIDLGHDVSPINFDSGSLTHDNYVDLPPYNKSNVHLKLKLKKYNCTSIGFYIIKNGLVSEK